VYQVAEAPELEFKRHDLEEVAYRAYQQRVEPAAPDHPGKVVKAPSHQLGHAEGHRGGAEQQQHLGGVPATEGAHVAKHHQQAGQFNGTAEEVGSQLQGK